MSEVFYADNALGDFLKNEYSRDYCNDVVTLAASSVALKIGTVLGKKGDGTYAPCVANAEGTTIIGEYVSTDVPTGAAVYATATFADVKSILSEKDVIAFTYDGAKYSCTLPSGTIDTTALNTAIDGAKTSAGATLGANKVTASFSTNDLVLTADAYSKELKEGKLTDVEYSGVTPTGEDAPCAVLLQDVPAHEGTVGDVLILSSGPAIVSDDALIWDESITESEIVVPGIIAGKVEQLMKNSRIKVAHAV